MLFQLLFGSGRMQTYTVHESPKHPTDRIDRAEALVFVKDGFALQAFVLGPLWLLARRLWAGFGVYAAIAIGILAANEWLGLPSATALVAFLGLHAVIGFEADTIERIGLEQKDWRWLGSVSGNSALECERRFFETWLHDQPVLAPRDAPVRAAPAAVDQRASQPSPLAATSRGSVAGRLASLWARKN